MNLKEYLRFLKWPATKFSSKSGVDIQTVRNVIMGFDVRLSTALKIEEFTHGEVTCRDLKPTRRRVPPKKKAEIRSEVL